MDGFRARPVEPLGDHPPREQKQRVEDYCVATAAQMTLLVTKEHPSALVQLHLLRATLRGSPLRRCTHSG